MVYPQYEDSKDTPMHIAARMPDSVRWCFLQFLSVPFRVVRSGWFTDSILKNRDPAAACVRGSGTNALLFRLLCRTSSSCF